MHLFDNRISSSRQYNDVLKTSVGLTIHVPDGKCRMIWRPVLCHAITLYECLTGENIWHGKPKTSEKSLFQYHLLNKNPTWTTLGLNSGLCDKTTTLPPVIQDVHGKEFRNFRKFPHLLVTVWNIFTGSLWNQANRDLHNYSALNWRSSLQNVNSIRSNQHW